MGHQAGNSEIYKKISRPKGLSDRKRCGGGVNSFIKKRWYRGEVTFCVDILLIAKFNFVASFQISENFNIFREASFRLYL